MNKLNKRNIKDLILIVETITFFGMVLVLIIFWWGMRIKKVKTPIEAFVNAKALVASKYEVSEDEIKLYRYDGDKVNGWSKVIGTTLFESDKGVYPRFIYTARVNDSLKDERILAVVLSITNTEMLKNISICGNSIDTYDVDVKLDPKGYVARIISTPS